MSHALLSCSLEAPCTCSVHVFVEVIFDSSLAELEECPILADDLASAELEECSISVGGSFGLSSGRYSSVAHLTKKSASTCAFMAGLGKYEMSYSESFTAHFAILPEVSGR